MSKNEFLTRFLHDYVFNEGTPEFAVLINGKWGSGKTYFIKELQRKFENQGKKFFYISLNGISTFKEIEDSIFAQLHPALASKPARFLGNIIKGSLKFAFKINVDGDQTPETSVGVNIPTIPFETFLNEAKDRTFIFDDIERCSIETTRILGYINQLVELNGYKGIILGNEEEIIKKDEGQKKESQYRIIKEKTIGHSFIVETDFESAFSNFLDQMSSPNAKSFLKEQKVLVERIYKLADHNNLRHLKQTIWDFNRFFTFLPPSFFSKPELVEYVVSLFFIYSIEIKNGRYKLSNFINRIYDSASSKNANQQPSNLIEKYPILNRLYPPFDQKYWIQFFEYGFLDEQEFKRSVETSYFFRTENLEEWERLWEFDILEDNEFIELRNKLWKDFASNTKMEIGVLLSLTGTFLSLSKRSLLAIEKEEVVNAGIKHIKFLFESNYLKYYEETSHLQEAYKSLGHSERDSPEFKKVLAFWVKKNEELFHKELPDINDLVISRLKSSLSEFAQTITYKSDSYDKYRLYERPIFDWVSTNDFVLALESLPNSSFHKLRTIFLERYVSNEINKKLKRESLWLRDASETINRYIQQKNNSDLISCRHLKDLSTTFVKLAVKLESLNNEHNS